MAISRDDFKQKIIDPMTFAGQGNNKNILGRDDPIIALLADFHLLQPKNYAVLRQGIAAILSRHGNHRPPYSTVLNLNIGNLQRHSNDESVISYTVIDQLAQDAYTKRSEIFTDEFFMNLQRYDRLNNIDNLSQLINKDLNQLNEKAAFVSLLKSDTFNRHHGGFLLDSQKIDNISASDLAFIQSLVKKKNNELVIKRDIATVTNPDHLNTLIARQSTRPNDIRREILQLSSNTGANLRYQGLTGNLLDHANNENVISNDGAVAIHLAAIQKKNELLIKNYIANISVENRETLLAGLVNRNEGESNEIRESISAAGVTLTGFVGNIQTNTNNESVISNSGAAAIRLAAIEKSNELFVKQYIAGITDPSILDNLASHTNANDIRRDLLVYQNSNAFTSPWGSTLGFLGNLAGRVHNDQSVISNTAAEAIRVAAIQRKNELLIKQYIAGISDPAILNDLANRNTGDVNDIRADILGADAELVASLVGTLQDNTNNESVISNATAEAIRVAAIQRKNELLIKNYINDITDIINLRGIATINIGRDEEHSLIRAGVNILNNRGGNVLGLAGGDLNSGNVLNEVVISNATAEAIRVAAIQKYNELCIKQYIANVTNHAHLNALVNHNSGANNAIRADIYAARTYFSSNGFPLPPGSNLNLVGDLSGPDQSTENVISNIGAEAIRIAAIQKKNELVIKQHIANVNNADHLDAFAGLSLNMDHEDVRSAITITRGNLGQLAGLVGILQGDALNDESVISNTGADAILVAALQRRNELLIKQYIANITEPDLLDNIADTTQGNHDNIRAQIWASRAELANLVDVMGPGPVAGPNNTLEHHQSDEVVISNDLADIIRLAAINQRNQLRIDDKIQMIVRVDHPILQDLIHTRNGDHNKIREIILKYTHPRPNGIFEDIGLNSGNINSQDILSNAAADALRLAAIKKVATLEGVSQKTIERRLNVEKWVDDYVNASDPALINKKNQVFNHFKERYLSFQARLGDLEVTMKRVLYSRSRDTELPKFTAECIHLQNNYKLYKTMREKRLTEIQQELNRLTNLPAPISADDQTKIGVCHQNIKNIYTDLSLLNNGINRLETMLVKVEKDEHQPRPANSVTDDRKFRRHKGRETVINQAEIARLAQIDPNITTAEQAIEYLAAQFIAGEQGHGHFRSSSKVILDIKSDTIPPVLTTSRYKIGPALLQREVKVVDIYREDKKNATLEIRFPKDISSFGEEGYIQSAIDMVDKYREKNPKKTLIIDGDLPKEFIKAAMKYCRVQGYKIKNEANTYEPSQSEINDFDAKLDKNARKYFGDEGRPAKLAKAKEHQEVTGFSPRPGGRSTFD